MKTTIGGDRLGSGNRQEISMRNYERSTHDLSANWRSSMAPGTLTPFMVQPALPGDVWDIDLQAAVQTLPTIGPLFGSYKLQLDVFQCPLRLYNAALHMNKLGIGMDMANVHLPQVRLMHVKVNEDVLSPENINQIEPSNLFSYLGIKGLGRPTEDMSINQEMQRDFNAVPFIAYYDIFKQYYANKQENSAYVMGEDQADGPRLMPFQLSKIDDMRERILQHSPQNTPFRINGDYWEPNQTGIPYNLGYFQAATTSEIYGLKSVMGGLAVKTYQSDLLNNWIQTEWIEGSNGINEITSVDTTGDSFTIDALNLANKVYTMLNRIAISGGTYDDWLDAVYTHERAKSVENPIYHGSLIKEIAFQEVISNAQTEEQPLGTLAGRGVLTNKNKGGRIKIKVDEHSYIIGIVSITPRIDYSQGNTWDVNLKTMDDFHKPALDAIGYQDLITEQMHFADTIVGTTLATVQKSAGKQPAWINYMTNIDRTYGTFADEEKDMFMTLNRRYDIGVEGSVEQITDLTTYIDPSKYNYIFANTRLDAQNFWVQIRKDITARRKMSAKVIPNL